VKRKSAAILVFLLVLAYAPSIGSAESKTEGSDVLREARKLHRRARSKADLNRLVEKYKIALKRHETERADDKAGSVSRELGYVCTKLGRYEDAVEYYEKALTIYRRLEDPKNEALILEMLGGVYRKWGKNNRAEDFYEKALTIRRSLSDQSSEARLLNRLGDMCAGRGEHDKAVELYRQGLAIERTRKALLGQYFALRDLGKVYEKWGKLDKAVEFHQKALAVRKDRKKGRHLAYELNDLGDLYRKWGKYDEAAECYKKALAFNYLRGKALALKKLVHLHEKWSKHDKAAEFRRRALAVKRDLARRDDVRKFNKQGNRYRRQGKYDMALDSYEKARATARDLKDRRTEAQTLNKLGDVYEKCGKYGKAVAVYRKALAINKDLKDQKGEARTLKKLGRAYTIWGTQDGKWGKALALISNKKWEEVRSLLRDKKWKDPQGTGGDTKDRRNQEDTRSSAIKLYGESAKFDKAVEFLQKSLALEGQIKGRRPGSRTLGSLALIHILTGNLGESAKNFDKARAIFGPLGYQKEETGLLSSMRSVYEKWGEYDRAVESLQSLLSKQREKKDRIGEARTLGILAAACVGMGRYDNALVHGKRSLAIYRDLKSPDGLVTAHLALGGLHHCRGHYMKATTHYKKSLALAKRTGNRLAESSTLVFLGNIEINCGRYDKALPNYKQSLTIARDIGDKKREQSTLKTLGDYYRHTGQYDKALDHYEKSLAIAKSLRDWSGKAGALRGQAVIYAHRMEIREFVQRCRACLRVLGNAGYPYDEVLDIFGYLLLRTGSTGWAEYLFRAGGHRPSLPRVWLAQSRYKEAKDWYRKFLASEKQTGRVDRMFAAHTGLGMAYEGLDDHVASTEHFRKAVELTEKLRSRLAVEEREGFLDVRLHGFSRTAPYEGLVRVLLKMRKPNEALKTSEYTKARQFAENLFRMAPGDRFGVPADILEKDLEINQQLTALVKRRQEAWECGNIMAVESLQQLVREWEARRRAHIRILREKYPLFAATKYPQPLDLRQTAIKDSEWVLEYEVTETGVGVFLVHGKEIVKAVFKPIKTRNLDRLVRKFREPLEVEEDKDNLVAKLASFDLSAGKKLADLLLGDILSDLPQGAAVIIVPDDSVGSIPFEALVLNSSGEVKWDKKYPYVSGAEFFGDRNPISYSHSLTALTLERTLRSRERPGPRRLVMADPVFDADDTRLTQNRLETKPRVSAPVRDKLMSIKNETGLKFPRLKLGSELGEFLVNLEPGRTDLFIGKKASKPVLLDLDLTKYGSLVFVTHGYFGKDLPGLLEPVLALTMVDQPEGEDGFMRMSEVMELKLNADMAALIACQTGLGRRISGEGTMGMGRAFRHAGARSVLMSLWAVYEQSSVKLVQSFFKNIKAGKKKLQALRLARKQIRAEGYDHPFFWAAFILVGEVD